MKIEVLNRPVEKYTSTWEGKSNERARQWCVMTIDGLPTAFQITTDPDKSLAPGNYELDASSFGVANGRLTLSRVVLVPVKSAASAKAAAV